MEGRRSIRDMPYGRRHAGLCAQERQDERRLWGQITTLVALLPILPAAGPAHAGVLALVLLLVGAAAAIRHFVWQPLPAINPANRDRGIASFTEDECWHSFRFRKSDLADLVDKLGLPAQFRIKGAHSGNVCGESATLYLIHRLHYPGVLNNDQEMWGRDFTTLDRIFNSALDAIFDLHEGKVCGNVAWYEDRFDLYNQVINASISSSRHNHHQGMVPNVLSNIFGFLDGTGSFFCRPGGPNVIQNAFWNRYYKSHVLIYQGLSFPDGLLVVEGPEPGFETDWMVWRDCLIRNQIENLMQGRVANGQQRLKLYADKMYWNDPIITAAYSRRHGAVIVPWMRNFNHIMAGIRVSVEWTFGKLQMLFKFNTYKQTQKLLLSPLEKQYKVSVLLANAHTCRYGNQSSEYFDCDPPTLDDYFNQ